MVVLTAILGRITLSELRKRLWLVPQMLFHHYRQQVAPDAVLACLRCDLLRDVACIVTIATVSLSALYTLLLLTAALCAGWRRRRN